MAALRDTSPDGHARAGQLCGSELAVCGGGSVEPAGILCQLSVDHNGLHRYRDGHTQASWPTSKATPRLTS